MYFLLALRLKAVVEKWMDTRCDAGASPFSLVVELRSPGMPKTVLHVPLCPSGRAIFERTYEYLQESAAEYEAVCHHCTLPLLTSRVQAYA